MVRRAVEQARERFMNCVEIEDETPIELRIRRHLNIHGRHEDVHSDVAAEAYFEGNRFLDRVRTFTNRAMESYEDSDNSDG